MLYLKHLSVKNYKKFDTLELDFEPGLTLIQGSNGSGKTTICEIISFLCDFSLMKNNPTFDQYGGTIGHSEIKYVLGNRDNDSETEKVILLQESEVIIDGMVHPVGTGESIGLVKVRSIREEVLYSKNPEYKLLSLFERVHKILYRLSGETPTGIVLFDAINARFDLSTQAKHFQEILNLALRNQVVYFTFTLTPGLTSKAIS